MGFNTWNRFGTRIDERLIEDTMEALVTSGLAALGYVYVNIDDGWMAPERDGRGCLVPDPVRFPGGIARLVERAHSAGLKLGLYSDCGHKTCQGLPASYGHEREDAETLASWGVDYLKHDWCHVPFEDFPGWSHRQVAETLYGRMSDAVAATGHPMVLSMCNWGDGEPWLWARGIAHLWRTTKDIIDAYRKPDSGWSLDMLTIFRQNVVLAEHAGPGGWNDPDMLEGGNGHMTDVEYRTHFALWCMMAAPLLIGTDLRSMSEETHAILGQRDLIAVDQDPLGRQARLAREDDGVYVLVKELAGGARAVSVFNANDEARAVALDWTALVGGGRRQARDLWRGTSTTVGGRDGITVEPHATTVWRVDGEATGTGEV
jgi:alpha-galactosidase